MKKKDLTIKIALTLLFAVGVFLFWAFPYRAALSYQEQYQLFLYGYDYLERLMSYPGGMATYIAEFLVQFFNNYWFGAVVMTALFVGLQQLTWAVSLGISGKKLSAGCYALTFLPVVALWLSLGDINVMPTFIVAVIMAMLTAWGFSKINAPWARMVYAIVVTPLFYWLFGPSVYLFVVLACVKVLAAEAKAMNKALWCVLLPVYTLAIILITSATVNHPLHTLLIGINYYRWPAMLPLIQFGVMLMFAVVVVVNALGKVSQSRFMTSVYTPVAVMVLIAAAVYPTFGLFYDSRTYELIDYDYLVRTNNWDAIIKKAERRHPDLPMSVCATNLALGMTNQLGMRAFEFYQNGTEGLVPAFEKETNSSLVTGEVYFQLGLINTAQRFYFEAMEAIPNYNKSSRCIKRLAETNMMRGNYGVAMKYLKLLSRTTFYRKWAQRHIDLINQPGALYVHPLYGRLRYAQIDDDFLFSEPEIDKIIGQLFVKNGTNDLAKQYLMVYPLLQRDLGKFVQYMQVIQNHTPYNPLVAQQAAMLAYTKAGQEIPNGVADSTVKQQFTDFAKTYAKEGKQSPALDRFKNTVWYYLIMGN